MNLRRTLFLTYAFFSYFFLISCSEEDVTQKTIIEEQPPAVLDKKIISAIYPGNNSVVNIKDSIVVSFFEKKNKEQTIEGKKYRAVVTEVSLVGVTNTMVWSDDSLKVTLYPVDMLKANTSLQVSVKAHWEVHETIWSTVKWKEAELTEEMKSNFITSAPDLSIKSTNIEYQYPIPLQYHFLINEHPTGFVKLKRGQESLFQLTGYEFKAVFRKKNNEFINVPLTYENESTLR